MLSHLHVLNVFIEGSIFYSNNFVKLHMPVEGKAVINV